MSIDTLSVFLTRLEQVKGWVNPWIDHGEPEPELGHGYDYSLSVDLTDDVVTDRGKGGAPMLRGSRASARRRARASSRS